MSTIVQFDLSIASGAAETSAIEVQRLEDAIAQFPAAWTAAALGFKVCENDSGTFLPLKDEDGNAVQIGGIATDSAAAHAIPTALKGARFCKLWSKATSTAAFTDVSQLGARAIKVTARLI